MHRAAMELFGIDLSMDSTPENSPQIDQIPSSESPIDPETPSPVPGSDPESVYSPQITRDEKLVVNASANPSMIRILHWADGDMTIAQWKGGIWDGFVINPPERESFYQAISDRDPEGGKDTTTGHPEVIADDPIERWLESAGLLPQK